VSLYRLGQDLLDLVFPPRCVVCHQSGVLLCAACLERFPRLMPPLCELCGRPVVRPGVCQQCRQAPLLIDGIRSVVSFEGRAREAIHQFKYVGRLPLASRLARLMADYWRANPIPADVITAVPLHVARQHERGYNQADLLAQEFGRVIGLPFVAGTFQRVRNTRAQVGLDAAERRANVRDAFAYQVLRQGRSVQGQHVLVIDDVCTTGSTLEACSVALKAAGAASVWGFTLARAA
jgi:ComF family protein